MKIIKVESCFMCPLSDAQLICRKLIVRCQHNSKVDAYGVGQETYMGTEGVWEHCPLEEEK